MIHTIPRVICGFPGVGKTSLFTSMKGTDFPLLDSDSSKFDKAFFPANYIEHIQQALRDNYWVLCSTHAQVRDALAAANIGFHLARPASVDLKDEYIQRYIDRGSPDAFVALMRHKWEDFFADVQGDKRGHHIPLGAGQYLNKILPDMLQIHDLLTGQ